MPPVMPEQRIEAILDTIIKEEGGDKYTNDPNDAGGETRFGVTATVARAFGYTGAMKDLPEATARAIYRKRYVDDPRFSDVLAIDPTVAAELIDTGVNMGVGVAGTFLQRALNAFNDTGARYAALTTDGKVGDTTIDALRAFVRWRGPMGVTALLKALNGLQAARYIDITEHNPSQRKYAFGWISGRVGL
jgi:lysozyme family protein